MMHSPAASPSLSPLRASVSAAAALHQVSSVDCLSTDHSLHSHAHALPNHLEGKALAHDRERNTRNDRAGNGRALAFTITHGDWLKEVQRVMREHVGEGPGGAKKLADIIKCSPRTAENYLLGRTTPSGVLDLRCLNKIPGYAALKRELADMETNLDPRIQAKFAELARAVAMYGDNLFGDADE